jgi:hypothetical protein
MSSQSHKGVRFDVWSSQRTWFWMVLNDCRGGAIGVAATEPEAIREARRSIEEMYREEVCPESPVNEVNPAETRRSVLCN